jgi:hypothetical protein
MTLSSAFVLPLNCLRLRRALFMRETSAVEQRLENKRDLTACDCAAQGMWQAVTVSSRQGGRGVEFETIERWDANANLQGPDH